MSYFQLMNEISCWKSTDSYCREHLGTVIAPYLSLNKKMLSDHLCKMWIF
jgi:hypothetical protein